MIDTHCHIFSEYYSDIGKLIEDIKNSGVSKVIVNGCDMQSNLEVLKLVKEYDIVYGAIGFHPTEVHDDIDLCMQFLNDHIGDSKIVAVGEIGLDYHYDGFDKNVQIELFKRQLRIAQDNNKPVIVHSRDAIKDTYDILSMYPVKGSIHAFSGSLEMAREFTKLGFYLGIGGVVTFKNANNIINVINNIDLSYILLETDSPYLTPVPFRGQQNSPVYLKYISKKIADIKGISMDKVSEVTSNNASTLFDF